MGIVGADGRPVNETRNPKLRGKDYITVDKALNMVLNAVGPLAIALQEAMVKIARLEDRLGITDESVAAETEPPKGTPWEFIQKTVAPVAETVADNPEHDVAHAAAEPGGDAE